jgi:hypothetical protein
MALAATPRKVRRGVMGQRDPPRVGLGLVNWKRRWRTSTSSSAEQATRKPIRSGWRLKASPLLQAMLGVLWLWPV